MPVSNFPSLTISLSYKRKSIRLFGQFRALLKEISSKNGDFALRKKETEKARIINVEKSCQVTWIQKLWQIRES